jgi:hypothetical protein
MGDILTSENAATAMPAPQRQPFESSYDATAKIVTTVVIVTLAAYGATADYSDITASSERRSWAHVAGM